MHYELLSVSICLAWAIGERGRVADLPCCLIDNFTQLLSVIVPPRPFNMLTLLSVLYKLYCQMVIIDVVKAVMYSVITPCKPTFVACLGVSCVVDTNQKSAYYSAI